MAKTIHIASEVNNLMRKGLEFLMFNFDPIKFKKEVDQMDSHPWCMFICEDALETMLKPYAENWERVVDKYFTWDQERWVDPVDQCRWIADNIVEIYDEVMDGVRVDRLDSIFITLEKKTSDYLDNVAAEIVKWAETHKFFGEAMEFVEDGEN